nr:hypothetical protein [Valsa mali var. pyri (nom. inval.)]
MIRGQYYLRREMPKDYIIQITPCWLLGLIEGEGCFSITSRPQILIQMHITAYNKQKSLMLAIKKYIDHLNLGDSAFIKINQDKLTSWLRRSQPQAPGSLINKRSFIF